MSLGSSLASKGICLFDDLWEAVIWCMGVGVKADRMRIVIILVPSI